MGIDFSVKIKNDFSIVNGNLQISRNDDEILQRIKTRVNRLYGEWFLDRTIGVPWYDGMLGSKNMQAVTFIIKQEILDTVGVQAVIDGKSILDKNNRHMVSYFKIQLDSGNIYDINVEKQYG